jgi:hypothetical protein
VLRIVMASTFEDDKISIQFSNGIIGIGNSYKRDEYCLPYLGIEVPLDDVKAYRDFLNEFINQREKAK